MPTQSRGHGTQRQLLARSRCHTIVATPSDLAQHSLEIAANTTDNTRTMDTPILLTADRLWDGTGAATMMRPLVRLSAGKIDAVEPRLLQPSTCSGERVDFPGCTILPGLIDTHVHLAFAALETNALII